MSNITIADANAPLVRRDLALYYAKSGQLWMAVFAEWDLDETTFEYVEDSYEILSAREFRGGGRGRYLSREVDPALDWQPASSATQQWTDYLGDVPWGDFVATADDGPTTVSMRYGAAGGAFAQQHMSGGSGGAGGTGGEVRYLHGDLIDSTMLVTNSSGAAPSSGDGSPGTVQYTAFGEILTPPGTGGGAPGGEAPSGFPRYQYAGAWGYESGLLALFGADSSLPPITLQHVGARWYQPEIGRFVQRDPIGLKGGLNLYAYGKSEPLATADPSGLEIIRRLQSQTVEPPVIVDSFTGEDGKTLVHIRVRTRTITNVYDDRAGLERALRGWGLGWSAWGFGVGRYAAFAPPPLNTLAVPAAIVGGTGIFLNFMSFLVSCQDDLFLYTEDVTTDEFSWHELP